MEGPQTADEEQFQRWNAPNILGNQTSERNHKSWPLIRIQSCMPQGSEPPLLHPTRCALKAYHVQLPMPIPKVENVINII